MRAIAKAKLVLIQTFFSVCLILTCACGAFADISDAQQEPHPRQDNGRLVLPPTAAPKGYSLSRMAKLIAFFNTGDKEGDPPSTPFQILYTNNSFENNFEVAPGTLLYVPVLYNNNSRAVLSEENFPPPDSRQLLLKYFYSKEALGLMFSDIIVDGIVHSLGSDYIVQVTVPKLADGTGTEYQTIAAFLRPLTKGFHTIEIQWQAAGAALGGTALNFSTQYTVFVR